MVVNYPNTWLTRSFLALSAHKSNKICNKIQNMWFQLPTYSVLHLQKQCLRKNVVMLNFCLCVYICSWNAIACKIEQYFFLLNLHVKLNVLIKIYYHVMYWKEKGTYTHFGCYLYKRCINCVNESVLNIHICTQCDTFLCKENTCVSHINGKGDRVYEREIQAVFKNRKNWFVQMHWFWIIWHKLKIN